MNGSPLKTQTIHFTNISMPEPRLVSRIIYPSETKTVSFLIISRPNLQLSKSRLNEIFNYWKHKDTC